MRRLWISVASTVLFVGGAEVVLRAAGFGFKPAPMKIWNAFQDRRLEKGRSLHVRDPRTLWTLRPAAGCLGLGDKVNAAGFRGPLIPLERSPGTLRIATLGDSSTFGLGVAWSDCYTARLGDLLERAGIEAEVLCGGIVGFTVRQGLEHYREHVRPYRPDAVVLAFGAINEHFPANLPDAEKIARLQREDRAGGLRRRLDRLRLMQLVVWALEEAGIDTTGHGEAEEETLPPEVRGDPDWPGVRRVTVEDFERDLRALVEEVRADGAQVLVVSMPRRPEHEARMPILLEYTLGVEKVARELGVRFLDARGVFRGQPEGEAPGEPFLEGDPLHPSPYGHGLLAEYLARGIL